MNGNEYILTFADIPDDIIHSASDDAAVRKIFRQHRSHRNKMLSIMCCCIVVAAAAIGFGSQGWFGKRPPVTPGGFVTRESTAVSDDSITEQTQNRRATVEERSTEPAKETESRISKTENTTQTVPTGTRNREGAPPKPPQTNVPSTTKVKDTPTGSGDEAVFYLRYTYCIVDSAFSAYRPGKVVSEERVGERLEEATAAGVYVFSDGRIEEDETLRCEIFSLKGVDPGIAVCVRFIDKGKGLTTDHYYLLYNPEADTSAIEAYLIPQVEANNEE